VHNLNTAFMKLRKVDRRGGWVGGGYINGEGSYLDGGWLLAAVLVLCDAACCLPSWRFKRSVAEGPEQGCRRGAGACRDVTERLWQGRH
jgi:hypothetical protein